jgi:hypothetical protein
MRGSCELVANFCQGELQPLSSQLSCCRFWSVRRQGKAPAALLASLPLPILVGAKL